MATKESFFTFNNKFYIQVDGDAIGSPLGPISGNIFLSHHEENWLNKCPIKFEPNYVGGYVDDIFVRFESLKTAHSFRKYISSKHQNTNFPIEQENIGSLSLLDVKIFRKNAVNLSLCLQKTYI